jgi:two-component system, NtrC family, nitrogen regulation sensor histidine kinase NtrY
LTSLDQPSATPVAEPSRRVSGLVGVTVVAAALVSALVTFLVMAGMTPILPTHEVVVGVLAFNVLLLMTLIAVVAWELWGLREARQRGAAAAGLHWRFVGLFSLVAALPAILVATVASITLDRGLDPWFVSEIKNLIGRTVGIAREYRDEQCRTIGREASLMADDLNRAKIIFDVDRDKYREFMRSRAFFLGFPAAMLVKSDGTIIERITNPPLENVPPPGRQELTDLSSTSPTCLIPSNNNVFRALQKLSAYDDIVLFVGRPVDPQAIAFLPAAEQGVAFYQSLEEKKFVISLVFLSMFALVALIVLLSAVWFGLSFANRLVAPIRRLIHAADQVASGNYYVQVSSRRSEGDLGHLSETFNKMTGQLRRQHDGLMSAADLMDKRRRFTEAVLGGVSAGVIGVDAQGVVTIVNPSAETLLRASRDTLVGVSLDDILPEGAALMAEARAGRQRLVQGQIAIERNNRERMLNVRVTTEHAADGDTGFVVTLDDITDLVTAQRTSAWADVARRIAHEIKNPLTPIQLSAERIRRKYGKVITSDREVFDQCTDTIVRQVDDIKRMVDEFSSFARMPKPTLSTEDIVETARQVVFLLRVGNPDIRFDESFPAKPLLARFDRRLLSQALTNIVKNATEGIAAVPEAERGQGVVEVSLREEEGGIVAIEVTDNGKGFPREHRQRLLEPYMTTREGGTGLGLPIVAKIFEDHGGAIELLDAPAVASGGHGARVRLWFPLDGAKNGGAEAHTPEQKKMQEAHP